MSYSLVDSSRCASVKRRVYMPEVADEYNSSSQPLNAVVLASILSMMSPSCTSKKLRHGYVVDLAREGGVSPCALMLGLLYIKRLSQTNPGYVGLISPRDLFLVSMVVASKYINDEGEMEALTNSDWARLGSMSKTTLDELERNFLSAIEWKLYVPLEEYYAFVNSVEARIALDQASRRGWFTYTDLTAIWDGTDLQCSMMLATKQAAKVATKGAALYLMCVATLFAASGTVPLTLDPTTALQLSTAGPALGSLLSQAGNYLVHSPSRAHGRPLQQEMFADVHNSQPNFEQIKAMNQKKVLERLVTLVSNDCWCPWSLPSGGLHVNALSNTSFLVVGGRNETPAGTGTDQLSDTGAEIECSNNSTSSTRGNMASPSSRTRTAAMDSIDSRKKTWAKLEDGLFLLLNLVASIRLSSSTSLPSHGSDNHLPHTPGDPEPPSQLDQLSTSGTFKSSTPPSQNNMDSETTGLSTVQLPKHPRCQACQQTVLKNAAVHWWAGFSDSLFRTFPNESTTIVGRTTSPVHHRPHLDIGAGERRKKHSVTMDCSHSKAVTDNAATTTTTHVSISRCSEWEMVVNSPKLNSGQLAVDLHWQFGGTGDTDHSLIHQSNSTPWNDLLLGGSNKTELTLTENLLLYANSLLMMAF